MSNIYRPTWAEINLDHINHNYNYIHELNPNKTIIPVIKADAYGHGAVKIMNFLYSKGVRFFAVSLIEEGIELRKENKEIKILMLGPILEDQFKIAETYKIDITLYDIEIIEALLHTKYQLNVHLKIDTGMNRYGLKEKEDILKFIDLCQNHETIKLEGLFTHFATANENKNIYLTQLERFKDILKDIKILPKMIHVSNSASSINYEKDYDFTTHLRLGISLYGLTLDKDKSMLKPVMSLHSRIVQIKNFNPGEVVGYGATYSAITHEKIGIIPIGYADGWLRNNKNAYVEINAKKYKTVGVICMGAVFVRIDNSVKVGDEVILFGGLITTDEVAKNQNTIVYEVCTNISKRVPRLYINGGNK